MNSRAACSAPCWSNPAVMNSSTVPRGAGASPEVAGRTGPASGRVSQQRHHVGVGQGDPAERVRDTAQDRFPIPVPVAVGLAGRDEFGDDLLDDAVEQGVLVRGVPVDRHRVAVEGLPEPAHGQRLDALGSMIATAAVRIATRVSAGRRPVAGAAAGA